MTNGEKPAPAVGPAVADAEILAELCDTAATLALKRRRQERHRDSFVKGPIAVDWIRACQACHPAALALALGIRMMVDRSGDETVAVGNPLSQALGLSPDARRRALAALERAGLVRVERRPGQLPRATLVPWPSERRGRQT